MQPSGFDPHRNLKSARIKGERVQGSKPARLLGSRVKEAIRMTSGNFKRLNAVAEALNGRNVVGVRE